MNFFNIFSKDDTKYVRNNRIGAIVSAVLVGCVFFFYLTTTKSRIDAYAHYSLQNQLQLVTNSIDAKLNNAKRSIAAASGEVSSGWRDTPDFDPVTLVDSIKSNYDFDILEFVDTNGINLMSGADRFNASDREYYTEGIQGKSGMWVNYNPKVSNEYLLDFYSPVYNKGDIVGVLVGGLGSKDSLVPIITTSYLGQDAIGVLFNEEERAIATSFPYEGELYSDDIYNLYSLTQKDKSIFSQHIQSKDGVVFTYEGDMGIGIASVNPIEVPGWGVVLIIPSKAFSAVYGDFTNSGILTLGCVIVIIYVYILYILGVNRYHYTSKLREDEDIIKGFSKVYHSVFMLDYNKGTAQCLRTRDPSAARYDIQEGKSVPINDSFIKYVVSGADKGSLEALSSLENLMYVKTMVSGKDFFSIDYNLAVGGRAALNIAYMGSEEPEKDGFQDMFGQTGEQSGSNRFLVGMIELD